jgi:hypothetical protein
MQFRPLGVMMNCVWTLFVGREGVLRGLLVILRLVVQRCFLVMVDRALIVTRIVVLMLPSLRYTVHFLWAYGEVLGSSKLS